MRAEPASSSSQSAPTDGHVKGAPAAKQASGTSEASVSSSTSGKDGGKLTTAVSMPHSKRVFLDKLGPRSWVLTDIVSHETHNLPPGDWALFYGGDEDHAAVVQEDHEGDDEGYLLVDDLLEKEVYVDEAGCVYIGDRDSTEAPVSLERLLCAHRSADVRLKLAGARASVEMKVYVCRRPQSGGVQVWWALFCLYDAMELSSFKKQPSKWVWESIARWRKAAAEYAAGCHFILSKHAGAGAKTKDAAPFSQRMFEQPAASTIAFIVMLGRWAFCSPASGGLREDASRQSALNILRAVLGLAFARQRGKTVVVFFTTEWECKWPRPNVYESAASVEFEYDSSGTVDMKNLLQLPGSLQKCALARKWASAIFCTRDVIDGGGCVSMEYLFQQCFQVQVLKPMAKQLVIAVSGQIERALADLKSDKDSEFDGSFSFIERGLRLNSSDMDQQLFSYVCSTVEESSRHRHIGIATDKANPCSGSFFNTVVSFPNNKLAVCCPQVTGSEKDGDAQNTEKQAKRKACDEQDFIGCDAVQKRQRAWLQREATTQPAAWRPVKLHRLSSKWWLVSLDNQIRTSTAFEGLGAFNRSSEWPSDWRRWPSFTLSMDLGSDGVAAWHFLVYKESVNALLVPDESHAIKNSFHEMLRGVHLWDLFLLLLVTFNLEFGPRQEECRRTEIRNALASCYEDRRPSQSPLFLELLPSITEELEGHKHASFPREAALETEVWQFLKERNKYGSMGRRVCMARYGASLVAATKLQGFWSTQLWERTFVALEHDYLQSRKCVDKLSVKPQAVEEATSGSTTSRVMKVDEKAIRGAAQNALVISVLTLQQRHHQRCMSIVCSVSAPLTEYHTKQNKGQRSVQGCAKHMMSMLKGGFTDHLNAFVLSLRDANGLRAAGFILPTKGGRAGLASARLENTVREEALTEDEYADIYGQAVLALLVARTSRAFWLYSWPAQMYRVLENGDIAKGVVKQFQADEQIYQELRDRGGLTTSMSEIERRHVMHMTANEQLSKAIAELGPESVVIDRDFRGMLLNRLHSVSATQICEDINGMQSISSLAPCRRYRRPATAMATVLSQNLISKRHEYAPIVSEVPAPTKAASLPRSAFDPPLKNVSMKFEAVVSTKQQCDWFSPSAERMTAPAADLMCLRAAKDAGDLGLVSSAWLGQACDYRHHLAIGYKSHDGEVTWYLGLHSWHKSSVLLWPCSLRPIGNYSYFELQEDVTDLVVKPIFSLDGDDIVCASFSWRSWVWQLDKLGNDSVSLQPAIRPVMVDGPASFVEVACRNAWWSLPRSVIFDFARYYNIDVPSGCSLFELLLKFGQSTLNESEESILKMVHRRVAEHSEPSDATSALLEIDEALEVLEVQDANVVKSEKKKALEERAEVQELRREYVARARAVRVEAEKKSSKKRKKTDVVEARRVLPHHLEQKDAKRYLPPDSSLWRSKTRGEWNGQYKNNRRVWEPFHKHGSSEAALKICLRRLWQQHLTFAGLSESDCPIDGIFGD